MTHLLTLTVRVVLALAPLIVLSACSGPSGMAPNGYPIRAADDVAVFGGDGVRPTVFEIIGYLETIRPSRMIGVPRVVSAEELERLPRRTRPPSPAPLTADEAKRFARDAQREAGRMGANAVFLVTTDDLSANPDLRRAVPFQLGEDEFAFVAIYVGPPPPEASGVSTE